MSLSMKEMKTTNSASTDVMRNALAGVLDPHTWETNGENAVVVHHLGFRNVLTDYFGSTFYDPSLQWSYDGGTSLHLRFHNGSASMFTKRTIGALAASLRAALKENIIPRDRVSFATPHGENGASILRIKLSPHQDDREKTGAVFNELISVLSTIIHSMEKNITEWLDLEARRILDTDPIINEKAPEGVRPYVNDDAEWTMIV
jgi:hypothetical protein